MSRQRCHESPQILQSVPAFAAQDDRGKRTGTPQFINAAL